VTIVVADVRSMSETEIELTAAPPNKKGGRSRPFRKLSSEPARSALRELEARARFLVAVFLALDDARVAGQEALFLQRAA